MRLLEAPQTQHVSELSSWKLQFEFGLLFMSAQLMVPLCIIRSSIIGKSVASANLRNTMSLYTIYVDILKTLEQRSPSQAQYHCESWTHRRHSCVSRILSLLHLDLSHMRSLTERIRSSLQ